jgi:anhydro-N-acetylmuramic acid kinase
MGKIMRAIGLMSGTSMDGIDVALIETDGEDVVERGPSQTRTYPKQFREQIQAGIKEAPVLKHRLDRPGRLAELEQEITRQHADAVRWFMEDHGIKIGDIAAIGFHGQTILHVRAPRLARTGHAIEWWPRSARVDEGGTFTVQLGDGRLLANLTGIDVVYDLRAADAAAGGEGAPLAPVYHRALAAKLPERPVVVLNIGGVANVTWIGRDGALLAFDTGPGNAMIDDWMLRCRGVSRDEDGALAAAGRVHDDYVMQYLRHSYFGEPPPKSLDRNAFLLELVEGFSPQDGAATLTAFTATSIARAREHFPEQPKLWVVSGGGRRNKTLMAMIAERVESAVAPAEAAGMDGDALEAEAWAYLAVRSLKGLPITFPGTTGAPRPLTGGVLATAK